MRAERERGSGTGPLDELAIDGPYPSIWMLDDRPGIWIVMEADRSGRRRVLDLGWARSVRSAIFDHPAVLQWRAGGRANGFAACYTEDPRLVVRIGDMLSDPGRRSAGTVG